MTVFSKEIKKLPGKTLQEKLNEIVKLLNGISKEKSITWSNSRIQIW